ncbi:unnamed protein product, partial [Ixodes hexagonus]
AVWSPWSSNQRESTSSMEQSNGIVRETSLINETRQHTEKNDERPGYRPVKFSPVAHLTQANKPQQPNDAVSSPTTPPSPSAALRLSWNPVVSELKDQHQPVESLSAKPATSKPLPPPPVPPSPASPTLGTASSPPATTNGGESPTSGFAKLRIGGSGLPPSQSPTITLLQKAREGQIPKGALYIDHNFDSKDVPAPRRYGRPNEPYVYDERVTFDGDRVHTDTYYAMPTSQEVSTGVHTTIKAPPKYEGIGPTINGIPVALRTNVKDEYASDWYKTMYKRLHKYGDGDYMTVGYRKRGNRHSDGYMSEPEFSSRNDDRPMFGGRNAKRAVSRGYSNGLSTSPASYKIQPRSIAEYEPGHSSIAEREQREAAFSSRYMPPLDAPKPKYTLSDGYESDTTLIRKAGRRMNHLDSKQQREWYKAVQRGEDIPLEGLGKPAPQRPHEPVIGPYPPDNSDLDEYEAQLHRYLESEVNIHYKTPVRTVEKEYIEEEELRRRQEAAMRKFYEDEFYKKQLQQQAEIEMRRHNDYFTPSQKSPIPLNRYENSFETSSPRPSNRTPEPRTLAKVLYNFLAQSPKEVSLRKGDLVYITRKIDRNWYEGEHHGLVGIFPVSYVEVIPAENANLQPRKALEGLARAKFNFCAQTPVELSFFRGETVVLMRRVDANWYEGRIGNKRGIFPVSYVEVVTEPQELVTTAVSPKPPASPVYSPLVNGGSLRRTSPTYAYPQESLQTRLKQPTTSSLHVDAQNEPISYRVLYTYKPQNDDELELFEGDTVFVMEKCDDGWYLGTSLKSGLFGTFPGNYVERI